VIVEYAPNADEASYSHVVNLTDRDISAVDLWVE
jgi:hypothetical protein